MQEDQYRFELTSPQLGFVSETSHERASRRLIFEYVSNNIRPATIDVTIYCNNLKINKVNGYEFFTQPSIRNIFCKKGN